MPNDPVLLLFLLIVNATLAMIVHELGHLLAARLCKVPASELGLGVGPKLIAFRLGGIQFTFRAIPVASFVMLDGTDLKERSVPQQLLVHLGGIILNLTFGVIFYGTFFGWMNLLLAVGNLMPLYQHDGWKCGVVIMRAYLQRKSEQVERAFTFSGGFVSIAVAVAIIRIFV